MVEYGIGGLNNKKITQKKENEEAERDPCQEYIDDVDKYQTHSLIYMCLYLFTICMFLTSLVIYK